MLLPPNPLSFWLSLLDTDDFYVEYLLRVYKTLNAQLSPLILSGGAGVWPFPDETSLLVSQNGPNLVAAPGLAVVVHSDYGAVVVGSGQTRPVELITQDAPYYVHAVGVFEQGTGMQRSDARENNALVLESSLDEDRDGALLLAQVNADGSIEDRRPKSTLWELGLRLTQVETDTGYNLNERAKGSIAVRLGRLEAPAPDTGGDGGGPVDGGATWSVTQMMWNTLLLRIEAIEGSIGSIKNQLGTDAPLATRGAGRVETLRAEHSRLAGSVVRGSPRAALRQEAAIVIAGVAGQGQKFVDGATRAASYVGGNLIVDEENGLFI